RNAESDSGVGGSEVSRNSGKGKDDEEEIERVESPAQKSGKDGSAMLAAGSSRSAQGHLRVRCPWRAGHRKVANDNPFDRDRAPSMPGLGSVILASTPRRSLRDRRLEDIG